MGKDVMTMSRDSRTLSVYCWPVPWRESRGGSASGVRRCFAEILAQHCMQLRGPAYVHLSRGLHVPGSLWSNLC